MEKWLKGARWKGKKGLKQIEKRRRKGSDNYEGKENHEKERKIRQYERRVGGGRKGAGGDRAK